nr:NAD(P)H-binding protein [Microbacterium barkeri]
MTILVTGATGNLGRLIIAALQERGADPQSIVAGARDTAKAAELGVRAVHLDYTDPASIATALDGIDTVVLVSGSEVGQRVAQHRAVIEAAKDAGVAKFIYTSAPKASTSDLVLAPEHKATEELIAAAGLPAVILRNNWYTENYAADLARAAETGVLARRGCRRGAGRLGEPQGLRRGGSGRGTRRRAHRPGLRAGRRRGVDLQRPRRRVLGDHRTPRLVPSPQRGRAADRPARGRPGRGDGGLRGRLGRGHPRRRGARAVRCTDDTRSAPVRPPVPAPPRGRARL